MPRLTKHYAHWPAGIPQTFEAPDCTLLDYVDRYARIRPDFPAIEYYGRQITYRELHDATLRLAGYLQQHLDVGRGDRVLLLMQNSPHFAIAYFAVLRCDAVVVALSPMTTAAEFAHYRADSGARVLVTTQDLFPVAAAELDDATLTGCVVGAYSEFAGTAEDVPFMKIPPVVSEPFAVPAGPKVHTFAQAMAAGISPADSTARGDDLAVIAYTSGTTGKPKGAMLSHRSYVYALEQRRMWLGIPDDGTDGEPELGVLPANHMAGMGQMHRVLCTGRTLVWLTRWDADGALELVERRRIGSFGGVTPMLVESLAKLREKPRDISSVRRLMVGATAMPDAVADELERRFGVPLVESYGLTEAGGATHLNPPQAARRNCAGIPYINVDARVLDIETGVELGPNQPGEIVTHGATVFLGYWNRPDATEEAFVEIDGKRFLRSGDIGYYDDDGYFYITDRLKRMINASGLKVWPAEIEAILYDHPAVHEACVISARDPRRGETVKAFVALRPDARGTVTPEELVEWSRTRMAAFKVPRQIEFIDALPRNATGKLNWSALQAQQDTRDRGAQATQPAT